MPSNFIWKSDKPNTSKKTIKVYSGSNWILEDNDHSSKSYIYIEQIVITESDNSIITFHTKNMPQDWIGSDLLEVSIIPYELIKSDNYGILEKIGDWMRFTTNIDIEFNINNIKSEFISIKKWINNSTVSQPIIHKLQKLETPLNNYELIFDPHTIQLNFNKFLNKYKYIY
jgi:hypothetical protein